MILLLSLLNLILRVDDYFETFILNKIHQIIVIHEYEQKLLTSPNILTNYYHPTI